MTKTCDTCAKRTPTGRCKVLLKPIAGDCWAWTDDPNWEEKVKKDTDNYKFWRGEP